MRFPATAFVTAFVAAAVHVGTQEAPKPRLPERGADLLPVYFSAVTQHGAPVTDLKPDELSLRIGSKSRPIRSMQLIEVAGPSTVGTDALPLPFGTNAVSAAGRTVALVIDEDSFRPTQHGVLRESVVGMLAAAGARDRISLVGLPFGGVKVPFTTDHSRIRTAIGQVIGHAPLTDTGSELACRTRRTLEALATHLEIIGGREEPLTIVFFTAAFAAPRRDASFALPPGMCELQESLFTRVAVAAGAARAQFYVVRPGDASDGGNHVLRETPAGSDHPLAGIDHLAGVTGGKLLALTGSAGSAPERILRETAAHYMVTIDALDGDRSDHSQPLNVRTSRRGPEIRSASYVTFGKPDPMTSKLLQPSLRDMLSTPVLFRDLPLRASAFPALNTDGGNVRVVALAEPVEASTRLETLGAVLVDRDGKVAVQWLATAEELARTPVMGAMSVPQGVYRMRVGAIDSTGRSGTVDYEVTAEVVRTGALKVSSLVLGLNRAGGFTPRLQFTSEPLAVAYVELEGAPGGSRVSAALDIATTVNGPAIVTVPFAIERTGENRYTATGSLAVGALPDGDYVARAMIGLEGSAVTRVVRTLRKTSNR